MEPIVYNLDSELCNFANLLLIQARLDVDEDITEINPRPVDLAEYNRLVDVRQSELAREWVEKLYQVVNMRRKYA